MPVLTLLSYQTSSWAWQNVCSGFDRCQKTPHHPSLPTLVLHPPPPKHRNYFVCLFGCNHALSNPSPPNPVASEVAFDQLMETSMQHEHPLRTKPERPLQRAMYPSRVFPVWNRRRICPSLRSSQRLDVCPPFLFFMFVGIRLNPDEANCPGCKH